jgi:hypothetical protein
MLSQKFVSTVLFFICLLFATSRVDAARGGLPTVDTVDLQKYEGRWYQVASNLLVTTVIEGFGKCVYADCKVYLKLEQFEWIIL